MFKWLRSIFLPFYAIAEELRIIRELYEKELMERDKPIVRITDQPKKGDVEVLWTDDAPKKKTITEKLADIMPGGLDDEDDFEKE